MRVLRGAGLILTGAIGLLVLLGLQSANSLQSVGAASANISQSYKADGIIPKGSIVSLDPNRSGYLQIADTGNAGKFIGVTVASDDSLLAIEAEDAKVQVATNGMVATLVSTLNGPIKAGDQIAVSPFKGIGMKASAGSQVVGLAQSDFSSGSAGARRQEVTGKDGEKDQIELGYINLSIAVGKSALSGSGGTQINGLQQLVKGITGRTISTLRIIISAIVFVVTLVALIILIYASIYGSIISIGRNPLGKNAVYRALGSVLGMVVLMAVVSGLTVFFLLR